METPTPRTPAASSNKPVQTFRIATWNCRMGLRNNRAALEGLACDIVVLQECAESDVEQYSGYRFKGPAKKGLAVLAFNGWQLVDVTDDPDYANMILARVLNPAGQPVCDLAGVWALTGTPLKYHEQFTKILEIVAARVTDVPVVIAGDLNASAQGPNVAGHAANVALAASIGLVSLYHHANNVDHGSEDDMTLRWIGAGGQEYHYHCDFIFASTKLANATTSATVGDESEWIESGRSDHAPVVADINLR